MKKCSDRYTDPPDSDLLDVKGKGIIIVKFTNYKNLRMREKNIIW